MRNILRITLLLAAVLALASMSFSQNCNGDAKKGQDSCTNTQGGSQCKLGTHAGTCKYNNNNYCTCFLPSISVAFKDIVVPGATETDTYAVNNKRVVVGDYVDSQSNQHGMILDGKNLTKVDPTGCFPGSGSTATAFYGINNNNVAVGWCTSNNGVDVAFSYNKANGKLNQIKIPGSTGVQATGINDKNVVVGTYFDSAGAQHGFVLAGSQFKKLDLTGATSTVAWAINNRNWITVYGLDSAGDYHSFYTPDLGAHYIKFEDPTEGPLGTVVHAVNDNGDIDGTVFDASNGGHGTLLNGNTYTQFDDPKASNSTRADGLNLGLDMVGRYSPSDGSNHGFGATPK
jgi:hypothetical protein